MASIKRLSISAVASKRESRFLGLGRAQRLRTTKPSFPLPTVPKGQTKPAQGNALGQITQIPRALKGRPKWIKTQVVAEFAWRAGYGAFSVSESNVDAIRTYIAQQHGHHRKRSFLEEFRQLLERHGVADDERSVWS